MTYDNLISLSKNISKYCVGMEGNISSKYENDRLIIKASGSKIGMLKKSDIVEFDLNGKQLNNFKKKGSMELGFHTFLLKFKDINFIAHTHPTNTLKILCSKHKEYFSNKRIFPDQVIFNGVKSCLVPYAKPGKELEDIIKIHVDNFIKQEGFFPKLILLENHGIIACGETIDECIMITDICEKSAEIYIGCATIGDVNFLTDYDIQNLINDEKEKYRKNLIL